MGLQDLYQGWEYGIFKGSGLWKASPAKEYVIEHVLYNKDVVCISSKAGVGKSVLMLQLLCCLTSGTPFLGTYKVARPMNVLYLQTEGDRVETLERLAMIRKHVPLDDTRWAHINLPGIALNVEKDFDMLMEAIRDLGMLVDVLMIDPLYTTLKGDMSQNSVATDWIRNIRVLKDYLDCSVFVNNHEGKDSYNEGVAIDKGNGAIFGSTFWSAFFNHNYKLKVVDEHHILEIGKNRSGNAMDRIEMKMLSEDTLIYVPWEPNVTDSDFKIKGALSTGTMTLRKIMEITGVSRATAFRALRKWEDKGRILVDNTQKQAKYTWQIDETAKKDLTSQLEVVQ